MTDMLNAQSFNYQARRNHARKMSQALSLQQALCAMLRICGRDPDWILRMMRAAEDFERDIPADGAPAG